MKRLLFLSFLVILGESLYASGYPYKIAIFSYSHYEGIPKCIETLEFNNQTIRWLDNTNKGAIEANIEIQNIIKKKLIEEIVRLNLFNVVSFEEMENIKIEEIKPRTIPPPQKNIFGTVISETNIQTRYYGYSKLHDQLGVDFVLELTITPDVIIYTPEKYKLLLKEAKGLRGQDITVLELIVGIRLLDVKTSEAIRSTFFNARLPREKLGDARYDDIEKNNFKLFLQFAMIESGALAQSIVRDIRLTDLAKKGYQQKDSKRSVIITSNERKKFMTNKRGRL